MSTVTVVAKFPQHSSLAVGKFRAGNEEHCERDYEQACAKLGYRMLWHNRMIAVLYVGSADLILVHYARILHGGWLHRGLQKPQTRCKDFSRIKLTEPTLIYTADHQEDKRNVWKARYFCFLSTVQRIRHLEQ